MPEESFGEKATTTELFRQKSNTHAEELFRVGGSSSAFPENLAKLISGFDFIIRIFGWENEINLTDIVTANQAGIDAKYHDDFKDAITLPQIISGQEKR